MRFNLPVKEFLEKVFDYGVSHHCIVGQGDASAELAYAAKLLKIEKFIVKT